MKLTYVGPEVPLGTAVPLPEGWPAEDHEEQDAELASVKLGSGFYSGESSPGEKRKSRTVEVVAVATEGDESNGDSNPVI